jgi:hypothetical protein
MNKRLLKRHKRQVARARGHKKLSEPDLRPPEQIRAAREASRATDGRGMGPNAHSPAPSFRGRMAASGSGAKTDA